MLTPSKQFLDNFIAAKGGEELMAGVQKLPRSKYPAGRGPNTIPYVDDYGPTGGSYQTPRGGYQSIDDEFPNPFGGSGPYMPGASLPVGNENLLAGVLGEPNRPYNRSAGRSIEKGPFTDLNRAREDARDALRRDLLEYPNPFGGGSAPFGGV